MAAPTGTPAAPSGDIVSVTIPADFFQRVEMNLLLETAKRLGMDNYRSNSDGSVTFYMTESVRGLVAETFADALRNYAQNLPGSADIPASIVRCELGEDFDTVSLWVTESAYTKLQDNRIGPAIYIPVSLYRLFTGEDNEDFSLLFTVYADGSNRMLESFRYPS